MELSRKNYSLSGIIHTILFILLCRNIIVIYPLYQIDIIDQIYTYSAAIVGALLSAYILIIKMKILDSKIILLLLLDLAICFFATWINNGSMKVLILSFYPTVAFSCFFVYITENALRFRRFLNYISLFLLFIAGLNFFFMISKGGYYVDEWFFMGLENQMSFNLLLGIYFNYLCKIYNKTNIRFYCYFIIHVLTAFAVGSASGLVAVGVLIVIEVIPFVKMVIGKINTSLIIAFIISCLVFLAVYSLYMNDIELIKWFTEDVLGKDPTFTGRTNIWKILINEVAQKPLLGYGYHNDSNFFILNGYTLSAHNAFFSKLYTGGIVSVMLLVLVLFESAKHIDRIDNGKVAVAHKIFILLIAIPMMSEAVTVNMLYLICFQGIALSKRNNILWCDI